MATPTVPFATEPQVKAIYAIGRAQLSLADPEVEEWVAEHFRVPMPLLDKRTASQVIDAMKRAAGGPAPAPSPVAPATTDNVQTVSREQSIIRQSSLKAALDFCALAGPDEAAPHIEDVFAVAERFEAWVNR